ncbi:MAG: gliding motility-associated ABC transporter ATP-binding subunit GldA [Flavihumibacter sp.]|nr:gliding motility-associated ABC transporter ATP-binding subunit GldA [Flavihumibacter sp.]
MSIEVKNLSKVYGTQKAVNGISFAVKKGEIVGFLGPNGAGKSTTMKMITGYLTPDGGSAQVCGIDVVTTPLETKKRIGYLPEANPLYFDMYVREYLDFVADLHQVADKKNRIEAVISTVGLTPESKKKIGQLSKGYKQRVGLAAALIHNPDVLILDEPTSGLDPNQIAEIRDVIKELGKEKTVLFSSHILQEVEAVCERVVIINKGTIVADDTLTNLQKGTKETSTVVVQFKQAVTENELKNLSGVDAVQVQTGNTIIITTATADHVKKQVLEFSLRTNKEILSIQTNATASLEEVFRSLTQGSKN